MSTTPKFIGQTISRTRAAAIIGISPDTMKRWAMQKRGPAPAAKLSAAQQGRVLYAVAEIERWRSDPTGYRWPSSSKRGGRIRNERHR
ncbi:MAG: hypothetical protein ACK54F_05665 [Planctomycetia bacterium]|jgi:hypothetical protein